MKNQRSILIQGSLIVLLLGCCWLGIPATAAAAQKQLWLVGGNVMPCPAMKQAQCQREGFDDQRRLALKADAIEAVVADDIWPEDRQNLRVLTHILLRRTAERVGEQPMTAKELWLHLSSTYISRGGSDLSDAVARNGIKRYADLNGSDPIVLHGQDFVDGLSAWERNLITDHLVQRFRSTQLAQPQLLRSFAEVLTERVQAIGDQRPARVLIVSSGRDDAFESVPMISSVLQRHGVQADWLALDAALALAIEQNRCDELEHIREQQLGRYQLAEHHPKLVRQQQQSCLQPERLSTQISAADGILMLDGSIALLQASWFNKSGQALPWTQRLRDRFERGDVAVMAVGAAAQFAVGHSETTPPMMQADEKETGGRLVNAWCDRHSCQDGHHELHGLGLFEYGSIDTYTAERGREYRLLRAAASGTGIGLGIDDSTVVRVQWLESGQVEMRVQGEGTVLLVDTRKAEFDANDEEWSLREARLSRLVPGTLIRMDKDTDYQLLMPDTHAGKALQLIPPNRLVDPYFFRSWTQWFVANELPYAEAEYHVRPLQALLRLQRPKQGFRYYISGNGLVGYRDLIADLSFNRS
jgi:cyanophycinase-like exopeptidase